MFQKIMSHLPREGFSFFSAIKPFFIDLKIILVYKYYNLF